MSLSNVAEADDHGFMTWSPGHGIFRGASTTYPGALTPSTYLLRGHRVRSPPR